MKDIDLTSGSPSSRKANGRTPTKLLSSNSNIGSSGVSLSLNSIKNGNGTTISTSPKKQKSKKVKETKAMMGAGNSKKRGSDLTPKSSQRKGNKQSPELRPRRRASQTYFFKYQLARNPLKAEEEDLKYAILASLQQCGNKNSTTNSSNNNININNNTNSPDISINSRSYSRNSNGKTNHLPREPTGKKIKLQSASKDSAHVNNNNTTTTTNNNINHQNGDSIEAKRPAAKKTKCSINPVEPPSQEYLDKYKPETEDFLTFICFRTTAPNFRNIKTEPASIDGSDIATTNGTTTPTKSTSNSLSINIRNSADCIKQGPSDNQNYEQCTSLLHRLNNGTNGNSPNYHLRRPTRQSPRLASSNRKISENESSNMGISNTAYDNSINYEEDMKRASIALEDMAHEINSSDGARKELAQESSGCISNNKLLSSPYKNNKHLVKGLMTREFAGAFADEDTIFESISNHKL